ncbi:MAG TPA: phosphatidate cytidylyltransferase [Rubrivivax sp.]|nr:phosphatidate cytidylyltransferase [Burkholderiales bacterium]HNU12403.1 phosphatidate cytidylyltransferase [Rubrivivax sp.]
MLRQRVITALVLVGLLLPALFADVRWPFALLTLVMIGAAGWEWGRLNGVTGTVAIVLGLLLAAAGAATLAGPWAAHAPRPFWLLVSIAWVLGGAIVLRAGPAAWPRVPGLLRLVMGLVLLWAGWLALVQARGIGINFILSVFCLVWMADIAAYFGGRALGRRKLAPSISPGKSWEGVWSGQAGVLVLAGIWTLVEAGSAFDSTSLFRGLFRHLGVVLGAVALLALAGVSVVGDLIESLVKRAAGAKDSSNLLPGHGGVLDRIDALLPVFPLAMALTTR